MESLQRSSSTGELGSLSAENVELDLNDFPLLPAGKVVLAGGRCITTVNPTQTLSEHSDNNVGPGSDMKPSFASMVSGASVVKAIEPEVTEGLTQNVPETSEEESVPLTEGLMIVSPDKVVPPAEGTVENTPQSMAASDGGSGEARAVFKQGQSSTITPSGKPVARVRPLPSDILSEDRQLRARVSILRRPAAPVEHHKKWGWENAKPTELWSDRASKLYFEAARKVGGKNHETAITIYEDIANRFPRSVYSVLAKLALAERFNAIPEFSHLKSEAKSIFYLCCDYFADFKEAINSKKRLNTEAGALVALDKRSEACFNGYFHKLAPLMNSQKSIFDELRAFCLFFGQSEEGVAKGQQKYLELVDSLQVQIDMMDDEIMDVLGVSFNLKSAQTRLKEIFRLREDWRSSVKKTGTGDVDDSRQTLPEDTNEYLQRIDNRLSWLDGFHNRHIDDKSLYRSLTEF